MGLFGNIMKVVLIVLISVFAVFMLIFGALFIFPNFYIFGYHVINSNGFQTKVDYLFDDSPNYANVEKNDLWTNADSVQIQTDGYDVTIRTIKSDEIYGKNSIVCVMTGGYTGFVKGETKNITYSSTQTTGNYMSGAEEGKKVYYVRISEPEQGFVIRNATKLTLIVPENTFETKPIKVVTKSGSISVGGDREISSQKLLFSNLSLDANTGAINFNNFDCFEKLSVTKHSGDVEFDDKLELNCNMDISMTSNGLGYIKLKKFGKADDPSKLLTIKTENNHTILGNIYGALKVISKQGVLEIDSVTKYVDLEIYETDTKLNKCFDGLQVKGTSGKIVCKSVALNVNAEMQSGSCTFSKTDGLVTWKSTNGGGITLSAPSQNVTLNAQNGGNIKVDCTDTPIVVDITSKSGNVEFSNVHGSVCVNKNFYESNCNIKGSFARNFDANTNVFRTNSGSITLTIPQTESVLLNWATQSGNVDITFDGWKATEKTTKEHTHSSSTEWANVWAGTAQADDASFPHVIANTTNGKIVFKKL